jgi:hypothetical protein
MAGNNKQTQVKPRQAQVKGNGKRQSQDLEYRKLTREDLDKITGEPLPERAAMSLINANVAAPINLAVAANVLSDNSQAIAIAEQQAQIDQSTGGRPLAP